MKKVIFALLVVTVMASASFAMVDSIYVNGGRVGVTLSNLGLGIEGSIPAYVNSAGSFTLGVRGQWAKTKITKQLNTYLAGRVLIASANAPSTTTVSILGGAEYKVAEKVAVFADITLFSVTLAGATTMTALTSNAQVYTGGRLYL